MGRKCAVQNCLSDSAREEDVGVTFHKIPLHTDIRPKWLQLCKISDDKKLLYVCSRHFLRADFCNFRGKKYVLRQGVLPSIFSWNKLKPKPELIKSIIEPEVNKAEIKMNYKSEMINEVIEGSHMTPLHIKTEPLDIKEEIISPNSTTIEQKIETVNTATGMLLFMPNTRIEALDFNQTWSPATIMEVDYEENEVLVHFDMYSTKYDEWIGINSSSIRALANETADKKKPLALDVYFEGDRCMANWTDAQKFPATVTRVIDDSNYEVLFDDGYVKTVHKTRMSKDLPLLPNAILSNILLNEKRTRKRKVKVHGTGNKKRNRASSQESAHNEDEMEKPEKVVKGKWIPIWVNHQPVGIDSEITMIDGVRKSVIVPDPKLPPNWEKHLSKKPPSLEAGGESKWEVTILPPDKSKQFRVRSEVKQYIEENPHLNLSESMFTFGVHYKNRRPKSRLIIPQPVPEETTTIPIVNEVMEPVVEPLNPNLLKILQVDDGFKCPIDGCGKNFRRENLAQMHVKHYHPKYTKFLDSTPNVADLAYARTVGENLDRSPTTSDKLKDVRPQRIRTLTPKAQAKPVSIIDEVVNVPPSPMETRDSIKDAEIIKLLNSKPFDAIKTMESSSTEPLPSGLPPSMYPDIKLKDLLVKSEAVPKGADINLKTLSSSTTRPTGIKTLLPVRKEEQSEVKHIGGKLLNPKGNTAKRRRLYSENIESPDSREILKQEPIEYLPITPLPPLALPEPTDTIIEGGEVIKIVRMKQEEIINCTCGITEEDGLMIQCELCLCWQHAYCNNIYKENEVPEKYICYICQNPIRQRNSKKYMHDQDWLKNGTLPTASYHCKDADAQAKRFDKLKTSHDLSGGLLELKDFMHSVKLKIKIAEVKNHPKLYLWSKPWDKLPLPEKAEIKKEIKTESSEFAKVEGDSMLLTLLKSSKEDASKIKDGMNEFPKIDINTLIANNLDGLHNSNIPQPEAAIESSDCRLNLLDHIVHCQNIVEERMSNFEKQLNDLDSSLTNDNDENYDKIRQATSMLLRDLNTLKELSQISSF